MDRIFSGHRRLLLVLCIAVLASACGQVQSEIPKLDAIQKPTVAATNTPQPTSTATPTQTPVPTPTAAPQAEIPRDMNMRQGPGTAYPVVRVLSAKTTVELLAVRKGEGGDWYRVRVDGDEGWVSATIIHIGAAI